jgi:hypothetical protein
VGVGGCVARCLRPHVTLTCAVPHTIAAGKEAQKLKGIGPKIALKIDEILTTVRDGCTAHAWVFVFGCVLTH